MNCAPCRIRRWARFAHGRRPDNSARRIASVGRSKRPERKNQFFVAVYQHLRERIRQDIIRTERSG